MVNNSVLYKASLLRVFYDAHPKAADSGFLQWCLVVVNAFVVSKFQSYVYYSISTVSDSDFSFVLGQGSHLL